MFLERQVKQLQLSLERAHRQHREELEELETTKAMLAQ